VLKFSYKLLSVTPPPNPLKDGARKNPVEGENLAENVGALFTKKRKWLRKPNQAVSHHSMRYLSSE
jgi:hypothetical protein